MFYTPAILAKKGELSQIWIAAHWKNKLTKQDILAVNIVQACEAVMNPQAPLALRLRGQLLYGVTIIHQNKVTYLSEECSDALVKIKMAFRPGVVNISAQDSAATPARINAPTISHGDEDGVLPSPMARTSLKNKFMNVEPRLDDDWIKLTPVQHTARRSLKKRTPTFDDAETRSTTTMDDREENWSEFPFVSGGDEASSIEVARKQDDTRSDIVSSEQRNNPNADQPVYNYDDGPDFQGGDDYYAPPSATDGGASFSKHSAGQGGEMEEGLLLSRSMNKSWIDDAAEVREDAMLDKNSATPAQKKKETKKQGGAASTIKRKKRVQTVTELTSEQIEDALADVSDIVVERPTIRDRVKHDNELRQNGLRIRQASQGFDTGMIQPATSGLHPRLVALFKQNAKPVPSGAGEKETTFDEEDVEVARARTLNTETSGANESGGAFQYNYDDGPDFHGDDSFRPSVGDAGGESRADNSGAPDELELTFNNEGAESSTVSPSKRTDSAVKSSGGESERWNPQTVKMMTLLRDKLSEAPFITYQSLAQNHPKSTVAKGFLEVLTLTTRSMIRVEQDEPFGEIRMAPGTKYETQLPGEQRVI